MEPKCWVQSSELNCQRVVHGIVDPVVVVAVADSVVVVHLDETVAAAVVVSVRVAVLDSLEADPALEEEVSDRAEVVVAPVDSVEVAAEVQAEVSVQVVVEVFVVAVAAMVAASVPVEAQVVSAMDPAGVMAAVPAVVSDNEMAEVELQDSDLDHLATVSKHSNFITHLHKPPHTPKLLPLPPPKTPTLIKQKFKIRF